MSEEILCPVCGARGEFRPYLESKGHRWVLCAFCGGGHKEPYLPETEDEGLVVQAYDQEYFKSAFFERRERFAENQARWLLTHFAKEMALVEIGPGLGLAAQAFLRLAPDANYHVVEPHPTFAKFIRERLGDGVKVHGGNPEVALLSAIREASEGNKPVLVYADNVVEHVPHPRKLFETLKAVLAPGSKALVDVPNERGLKYRARIYEAIGGQSTVAIGHINLFDVSSMSRMLSGLGLQHRIDQRGIRKREEVNCLPEGVALDLVLGLLRVFPIDVMLGIANNLRVAVTF